MIKNISICVIGMGYVGLPLANALSKYFDTYGYDTDKKKIKKLKDKIDQNNEVVKINRKLKFSDNQKVFLNCNTFIICLPTPINKNNIPDLSILRKSYNSLKKYVKQNSTVILESTVYPGTTEYLANKYLKKVQNLGYSPERINPGDKINTIDKITKVISANNNYTLNLMKKLYGKINNNNLFKAKNIKTAEAAKIIENTQRDLNIGFINEVTKIFDKDNISIYDVLDAANTKWNFLNFKPGLVGGHCIGIDPYYLSYYSKKIKEKPELILSARKTNEKMMYFYFSKIMNEIKKHNKNKKILFMGITFKENVNDLRNSKYFDLLIKISKSKKCYYYDPLVNIKSSRKLLKFDVNSKAKFKTIILAVNHKKIIEYLKNNLNKILEKNGTLIDLNKKIKFKFKEKNYNYISL